LGRKTGDSSRSPLGIPIREYRGRARPLEGERAGIERSDPGQVKP